MQRVLEIRRLKRVDSVPLVLFYARRISPSQPLCAATPHSHWHDDEATRVASMGVGHTQQRPYNNNNNYDVGDIRRVHTEGGGGGDESTSMGISSRVVVAEFRQL